MHMDITPYVERLRADLLAAADASSPEAKATAERLGYALDASARLALMEAISHAAAEITSAMPAGGVEVRLEGRDLEFAVAQGAPAAAAEQPASTQASADDEDDGNTARITLRIPESVKARAEEYAARSGHSLNTWLVNVVRSATREDAINVDINLSSIRMLGEQLNNAFGTKSGGRRMTGWI